MHIPKWLIVTAGLLFAVLIAAVAFFVGRTTAPPPAAAAAVSAVPRAPSAVRDSGPEPPKLVPEDGGGAITSSMTPPASGTALNNATTSSARASGSAADNSPATAETRARVAAYFTQMEAIRSGGAVGDQQEFAMTVVTAAVSGDFSAIDDLVRAAGDAERRAAALQPPSECAEYHQLAMTLLRESLTMITTLRDGLKRNDTDALTSIAASAQVMESRAEHLAETEKSLRARFGLPGS
jgi:hypothetical protein